MKLKVIVLAAAPGNGQDPGRPSAMHDLAGRPMVAYVADAARALAADEIVVLQSAGVEGVREAVGGGVNYVAQAEGESLGQVLAQTLPAVPGNPEIALILYGDAPLLRPQTLEQMIDAHQAEGAAVTVLFQLQDQLSEDIAAPEAGRDHLLAAVERQDPSQQAITGAVGEGVLCFDSDWLWANLDWLSQDDFHLSDLVALASEQGDAVIALPLADPLEVTRADDLLKLASAEADMRRRINQDWLLVGVAIVDPAATYIESEVQIGAGTVIWPNTYLQGETRIGQRCTIGPGSVIRDSSIGDGCKIELSVVEEAIMEEGSEIGPFGHLRRGAHLGPGVHMGNFGEVKNSYLGPRVKMGHMSYLGDATVGADANIGAGTITCNYDGKQKNRTVIGEDAFIGSDTMLVAPVTVGARARTGAGSVVTRDVPPDSTAYGVPARPRTKSAVPATGKESGPIPGSDMQDEPDPAAALPSEED